MLGHYNVWNKLIPLYEIQLNNSFHDEYGHDEETLLQKIYLDDSTLFQNIFALFPFYEQTKKQDNIKKFVLHYFAKQFSMS
jgi:hypothetical protein